MGASLTLAAIAGIPIKIHWSFWVLVFWAAGEGFRWWNGWFGAIIAAAAVVLMFACVMAHELGHALAARKLGLQTRGIVLFPFGGVAQIQGMPPQSRPEILISLAGPLVNLALALIFSGVFVLSWGTQLWAHLRGGYPEATWLWLWESLSGADLGRALLGFLILTNLLLAVFNLVPAFPMDGGRLVRAVLALWLPFPTATRLAARMAQVVAVLAIVFTLTPLFGMQSLATVFIAVFVFVGATFEDVLVHRRWGDHTLTVDQLPFTRSYQTVTVQEAMQTVIPIVMQNPNYDLLVVDDEEVVGLLRRDDILQAWQQQRDVVVVGDLMRQDVPRVQLSDSLHHVRQLMTETKFTTLPVYQQDTLQGLINVHDLKSGHAT